ncbi:MAG: A24 family peptidase C-terminal domain-containing protein [Candidatus Heimdallarchaeaceae archaeon]
MVDVVQLMLYIQVATVIICLLYGSIIDIIKREISDIPWIIMAAEGVITSIILIIFSTDQKSVWRILGINFSLALIIGILLYYTGVMGGADAKAIMALSVNTAIFPFDFKLTSLYVYSFVPPVFSIFFNWLLVMIIIYPIPLLFYNLSLRFRGKDLFSETNATFYDKILALISGYPLPVEKAKDRHDIVYSEVYNEETKEWKIKHFMQVVEVEEEEKFKREIEKKIEETSKNYIWIKVLPPGIVFLLIGYVLTLFIGNPLFALLYLLS